MRKLFLSIFVTIFHFIALAQQPVIRNLVFEGAGIRGIAYCGIVQELESRDLLQPVEKVGGTSSGAIVALGISLGYTAKEIQDIVGSTNFRKFNDGNYFFVGGINRVNRYFGWYRGRRFEKWLAKLIEKKTGDADITFEALYNKGFKSLYVTGTCLNKQQLIIFSHETYPKMKVKDAVRISMSIPLYFEAVFLDKEGNVVKHPRHPEKFDIMVDGGFTGNFPIKMFDSLPGYNPATLGFRIDSDAQIANDREERTIAPMPIGNFRQYLAAFYTMIEENLNRPLLSDNDWKRTVSISDGKVPPRIRKLSAEEINILINNGRQALKTYLN